MPHEKTTMFPNGSLLVITGVDGFSPTGATAWNNWANWNMSGFFQAVDSLWKAL
jgi:hypothetical protein